MGGVLLLACETCGAELRLDAVARTATCPYCASPSVVDRPASRDRPDPMFAVGFGISADDAKRRVRAWAGSSSVFAETGFGQARVAELRGVYVPAYLYSAVVEGTFQARIGEDYTETETYTDFDGERKTRTVTRTEYRDLSGPYASYVSDVLVTASKGLPNAELEAIEPFDLRGLRRFTPALISGWISEEPSLSRDECMALARGEASGKAGRMLTAHMPGDSHSDLTYQLAVRDESADLVLVPVWVMALRHDPKKPATRVCMNGQTGTITGKAPMSTAKILVAVLLGLALLIALAVAVSQ